MTRRCLLYACLLASIWLRCAVADEAVPTPANNRHADLRKFAPKATPNLRALGFDVLTYPRMCGSTSTQPLAALIACRCFGLDYEWASHPERFQGLNLRTAEADREFQFAEYSLKPKGKSPPEDRLARIITGMLAANTSTHDAYVNLIAGETDIGLLARPPSPTELEFAKKQGAALDVSPCALDAFLFLVNERNPMKNLTTAQIRSIYSGKILDWRGVANVQGNITAYQREENSGSQE